LAARAALGRAQGGRLSTAMVDRFPYSSAEFKRVRAVQFGILSPDELVRRAGGLPRALHAPGGLCD
jgi:hypothetical protein